MKIKEDDGNLMFLRMKLTRIETSETTITTALLFLR